MEKGAKVAGYIRVSTTGQVENGHGLAEQVEAVEDFCEQQGYELVRVYEDAGVSGANGIEGRSALGELLIGLEESEFEGVVITRLDRLARDLIVQEGIIGDLRKCGGELVSIAEPDLCSEEPTRVLVRQVIGAISEYEKKVIVARLAAGRRRKRRESGFAGGNFLPYGYRVDGQGREAKLAVDRAEAKVVKRIFEEYAGGASMREIAERLATDAVPTKRNGRWQTGTVGSILANDFYAHGHDPLIDETTWQRCKRRRRRRAPVRHT